MKKGYTEIVYILDRSGSMSGLEADTIGGFNSMIKKQKDTGEKAYVSTVLFDDTCEVLHDRIPINRIKPMTDAEYYVRGCTALLDAVGRAIHHIGNVHKYARKEDRPEKTIFVITTDGLENSSRNYNNEEIKNLINNHNWEFIFIGADIDSYAQARNIGIKKDNTANYSKDSEGIDALYCSVSMAREHMDEHISLNESDWKRNLEKYDD